MLDACTYRYRVKHRMDEKTYKLMERMDLDRPILQKEKYDLIFLEKPPDIKEHDTDAVDGDRMVLNEYDSPGSSPKSTFD